MIVALVAALVDIRPAAAHHTGFQAANTGRAWVRPPGKTPSWAGIPARMARRAAGRAGTVVDTVDRAGTADKAAGC